MLCVPFINYRRVGKALEAAGGQHDRSPRPPRDVTLSTCCTVAQSLALASPDATTRFGD